PAHLVVEDLRRGAGDGVQARLAQLPQPVPDRYARTGRPGGDLHGRERVHVDVGYLRLDRAYDLRVPADRELRIDATLQADLGRTRLPGLGCPAHHFGHGQP